MSIKETLQFVNENPESPESREVLRRIEDGRLDNEITNEGIDPNKLRSSMGFTSQTKEIDNENLGTGFKPTFESNEDDSLLKSSLKTVGNVPKSSFRLGADITSAVTHPVRTVKAIGGIVKGAGGELGEAFLEKTKLGNALLEKANESRIAQGLPELQRDDEGKLQAEEIPEMQITEQLGDFVIARYGSLDALKESMVEDPVGVLADIAGIVSGSGATLRTVGTASKVEKLASVGSKISKFGYALEPTSILGKGVKTVSNATKKTGELAKGVVRDIIPNVSDFQSKAVVKALEFTQGDVKKFKNNYGKNIGEYISDKKVSGESLLGTSPEQTLINAKTLKETSYNNVRKAISEVTDEYNVGSEKVVLEGIENELSSVGFGFEDELSEIRTLIEKDSHLLSDKQRIKEIIDERYNIYKKSGDVASGNKAQALSKERNKLKKLIEKETLDKTGVDVGQLNEDVRIAYAIEEAIESGSLRELTKNEFGLNDYLIGSMLGVGVFGGGIGIETAIGLFVAKKTLESPAFRIGVAKGISKLKNNKVVELTSQLKANTLNTENKAILKSIIKNAEKSAPVTGTLEKAL